MSSAQLARHLGITKQSLHRIEKNERSGAVTVETLKRIADALFCDLDISFAPRVPLQTMVEERALKVAQKTVERTELHMGLEKQGTGCSFQKKRIREMADELVRTEDRRLWEDF